MRLIFLRHAEPDYAIDGLTEKGHREAALLAAATPALHIDHCHTSPLGRARETAAYCLDSMGKTAVEQDWLEEFNAPVDLDQHPQLINTVYQNSHHTRRIPWDILPSYYAAHPELSDPVRWRESEICKCSSIPERYDAVTSAFDDLLGSYGYVHKDGLYRVEKENRVTLGFFCHYGITCVLLSALWNISPFLLWQSLVMLPSTVTEVVSEERQQGLAWFRAVRIGDQSHLYSGNEAPSFAARFCEVYSDFSTETGRH